MKNSIPASAAPTLLKITNLRPFEGHPYKVQDDAEMGDLMESIKENGILTPLVVRPIADTEEYEVISGHRRLYAAQKAGPPLPWWTAICIESISVPPKRRLPIS